MLNEDDLLRNEKPFRMGELLLPGVLDFAMQLEFLRTVLPNPDLILYGNLPSEFISPQIPAGTLSDFNTACIKLRTLFDLLQNGDSETLLDSISEAVDIYRSIYPEDYQGLEILYLEGKLIITICNKDDLSLQVVMECIDGIWQIVKLINHFKLNEYNLEIRSNLQGSEVIVLSPPNDNVALLPALRDTQAIATIRIPTESYDDWYINMFKVIELPAEKSFMYDYFTIVPNKKRVIDIRNDQEINEQIIILPSDYGINITDFKRTIDLLPDGYVEIFCSYRAIFEAGIDIEAKRARNLVSKINNLESRASIFRRQGNSLPKSTRIEYFKRDDIRSFEVRFRDDMTVNSIIVDDKVYIDGEFTLFLSEEGYYIFLLGDNSTRIPVNFSEDFSMNIPGTKVMPVFTVINDSIGVPLSISAGLGRIVCLN